MDADLTILYTAGIRGDLALLPRLYTLLRRLKAQQAGRVLLLDAGQACDPGVWHCAATGGRSALLVLDAMGYAAANAADFLTDEGRARLAQNRLVLVALRPGESWMQTGIVVTTDETPPSEPYELHIILRAAGQTRLENRTLRLSALAAGQVGLARIGGSGLNGYPMLRQTEQIALTASVLPDPTITATVDFVLSEARQYGQKRGAGDV
jgi:hypothetical protein